MTPKHFAAAFSAAMAAFIAPETRRRSLRLSRENKKKGSVPENYYAQKTPLKHMHAAARRRAILDDLALAP